MAALMDQNGNNVETSSGRNVAPLPSELAQVLEMAERVGFENKGKSLTKIGFLHFAVERTPKYTPAPHD